MKLLFAEVLPNHAPESEQEIWNFTRKLVRAITSSEDSKAEQDQLELQNQECSPAMVVVVV